jgi:inorganic pyrophosphatase
MATAPALSAAVVSRDARNACPWRDSSFSKLPSKVRWHRASSPRMTVVSSSHRSTEYSMRIDAISIGKDPPQQVNVIIEVAVGGEPIKYEMDKEAGTLVVDRFLYTAMRYPGNYGFIPHTLSDDGDPCDVLVANTRAIVPGAVMAVRPVGVLFMEDEAGGDEKIIAVPTSKLTQRYDKIKNYSDLPDITLQQIQHFFEHYKDLEPGKWVKVTRWGDAQEAFKLIEEGIARAKAQK